MDFVVIVHDEMASSEWAEVFVGPVHLWTTNARGERVCTWLPDAKVAATWRVDYDSAKDRRQALYHDLIPAIESLVPLTEGYAITYLMASEAETDQRLPRDMADRAKPILPPPTIVAARVRSR